MKQEHGHVVAVLKVVKPKKKLRKVSNVNKWEQKFSWSFWQKSVLFVFNL